MFLLFVLHLQLLMEQPLIYWQTMDKERSVACSQHPRDMFPELTLIRLKGAGAHVASSYS